MKIIIELKKAMKGEVVGDTRCNWCTWNNPQKIGKRTGGVGN